MLKMWIRTLAIVLVIVPMAVFMTDRTATYNPSNDPSSMLSNLDVSTNQNKTPIPSFRSPSDECYDVALRDRTRCRNANKFPARYYRSPPDESYDVPLREVAICRDESHSSIQPGKE